MQCFFCPNPAAHPQTGHQYNENVIACEECATRFWSWFITHNNGKGRRSGDINFYDCVGAIRPPVPTTRPCPRCHEQRYYPEFVIQRDRKRFPREWCESCDQEMLNELLQTIL